MLKGATDEHVPSTSVKDITRQPLEGDLLNPEPSVHEPDEELTGATFEITSKELSTLRLELCISSEEDEHASLEPVPGPSDSLLKGATPTICEHAAVRRTMEDAVWKASAKDFLIVDDNILNMPDCTLLIRNLSDREIEIEMDPKLHREKPVNIVKEIPKESETPKDCDIVEHAGPDNLDPKPSREDNTAPIVVKPKIKLALVNLEGRDPGQ